MEILCYEEKNTSFNNGVLIYNSTKISSGSIVYVDGTSITFNVGNIDLAINGQARITELTITYK